MEIEQSTSQPVDGNEIQSSAPSFGRNPIAPIYPQQDQQPCPTCGNSTGASSNEFAAPHYVYALGRIGPRFPNLSVEKEFAQLVGRAETAGLTDKQVTHELLSQPENLYLVLELCWVLTIEGLDTYILYPRHPSGFERLIESLRLAPRPTDVDVVVGLLGPIASPEMCNGLMLPVVAFDQIYSFDVDSLLKSIPRPENIPEDQFGSAAEDLLWRIMQLADNAGATDEHRALNYLALRYPAVYEQTAMSLGQNCSLTGVDVRPSRLSSTRKVVDVIFAYTSRQTDVTEKFFVRVDVTEKYPFLVTKLSPYYER